MSEEAVTAADTWRVSNRYVPNFNELGWPSLTMITMILWNGEEASTADSSSNFSRRYSNVSSQGMESYRFWGLWVPEFHEIRFPVRAFPLGFLLFQCDHSTDKTWEHSKTFNPEDMEGRLDGKNCIVTGANSGIGFAAAQALATRGASVYMICRSKERGEAAIRKIQSDTGNQNVHLEVCDLSSVKGVKLLASTFSSTAVPVHVLVNNAGVIENERIVTSEGFEMNFAVNVLGTYAMTELMMPLLEKTSPDARVITVASGGMYTSPLTKDLQFSEGEFDGVMQYARNKRVQVALTEKWAELYKDKGIGFYSMHPGWAATPGVAKSLPSFSEKLSGKLRSSEEGADTIVWLALQPKEKLVSGALYFDRAEVPKHLPFCATASSHSLIDSILADLRSFTKAQCSE